MQNTLAIREMQLKNDARQTIIRLKWQRYWSLKFELGQLGCQPGGDAYHKVRDEIRTMEEQLRLLKTQTNQFKPTVYVWMTINIKPSFFDSTDWREILLQKLEKTSNSKMYKSYMYVIEQRKTVWEPHPGFCGQHIHLLLKRNDTKYVYSQIVRNAKRTWEDFCDVKNPQIFNIRPCPESFIQDKIDYMLGKKTDSDKPEKCKVDKEFRKYWKIKDYYESEDKFFSNYKL